MQRVEDAAGAGQRVHRRVNALLGDRALQGDGGVQVREDGHRGRVGVVVGRHVHRLHRGDRAGLGGGDALLQLAHLGGQRRLVAHGGGHTAQQRRHFGAAHDEAEDVVDEQQHVAALVAEILGHRQAGQGHAQAHARRLVHLAEDHHRVFRSRRDSFISRVELRAFAGALAHPGKDRVALVHAWRWSGSAP